jgi:hypothetical protein
VRVTCWKNGGREGGREREREREREYPHRTPKLECVRLPVERKSDGESCHPFHGLFGFLETKNAFEGFVKCGEKISASKKIGSSKKSQVFESYERVSLSAQRTRICEE